MCSARNWWIRPIWCARICNIKQPTFTESADLQYHKEVQNEHSTYSYNLRARSQWRHRAQQTTWNVWMPQSIAYIPATASERPCRSTRNPSITIQPEPQQTELYTLYRRSSLALLRTVGAYRNKRTASCPHLNRKARALARGRVQRKVGAERSKHFSVPRSLITGIYKREIGSSTICSAIDD